MKTFGIFLISAGCAFAQVHNVPLGAAANFAVLASSTITNTGNSLITGDVGVYPGTMITGFFPPGTVVPASGLQPAGAEQGAQAAALSAYNNAMGQLPVTSDLSGQDLGGKTLVPGIYKFDSSAQLTGTLTLNGGGFYVFQIGSTLTTASGAIVVAENGADAANVFWQVGSSATLGMGTTFIGNILASASITTVTGVVMAGRLLALGGAVTMDDITLTNPPATTPGGFGGPPATPAPASWILVLLGLGCVMLYQTRGRWLPAFKRAIPPSP